MLLTGIARGIRSGKTTFTNKITKNIPVNELATILLDSYSIDNAYLHIKERQRINFDHSASIGFELLVDYIIKRKAEQEINKPIYSYLTVTSLNETHETIQFIKPNKQIDGYHNFDQFHTIKPEINV